MDTTFENKLIVGNGIYAVSDIARILQIPYSKVNHWLNVYWDGRLGKQFKGKYSWRVDSTRAVSFHTLVEFYVMMQFAEAGVKPGSVLTAHEELSDYYNTMFPFANKQIIENMGTDGKKIYFNFNGSNITLDGSKQFNLDFITLFFKKIEFDNEMLASRLWPLGKGKPIVCDPHHKFGQPVIDGTNVQTEALYKMYLAKEPVQFIASLYELPLRQVREAINFHKTAA